MPRDNKVDSPELDAYFKQQRERADKVFAHIPRHEGNMTDHAGLTPEQLEEALAAVTKERDEARAERDGYMLGQNDAAKWLTRCCDERDHWRERAERAEHLLDLCVDRLSALRYDLPNAGLREDFNDGLIARARAALTDTPQAEP